MPQPTKADAELARGTVVQNRPPLPPRHVSDKVVTVRSTWRRRRGINGVSVLMSLMGRLMAVPPSDTSGSRSANRFDYQLDWAILQALELFSTPADFVIVLDFHDDILVLDSASDPSRVECYQIKSKRAGNWTVSSLIRRDRGRQGLKPSVLGKLYSHTARWGPGVSRLCFASNAPLSADGQSGGSTLELESVLFTALSADLVQQVASAIEQEANLGTPLGGQLALFEYRRSALSADGHQDQSIGRLARFLEARPDTTRVPAAAFYRTLKSEMALAVQRETCPTTYEDLCRFKSLTRERFAEMLADAAAEPARGDLATALVDRLNQEHVPFRDVQAVRRHATALMTRRMDPTNQVLNDDVGAIVLAMPRTLPPRLWDAIEAVRSSLQQSNPAIERRHGLDVLRSLIGMVLLEQAQLSGAHPESPEETA